MTTREKTIRGIAVFIAGQLLMQESRNDADTIAGQERLIENLIQEQFYPYIDLSRSTLQQMMERSFSEKENKEMRRQAIELFVAQGGKMPPQPPRLAGYFPQAN